MTDVLVVGNNTVDLVFMLKSELESDQKYNASRLAYFGGGQAANVAHSLAGMGLSTQYIGVFGSDGNSIIAKSSLEDIGVSLNGSATIGDCSNHIATVFVNSTSGERTIVMYKDKRLDAQENLIRKDHLQELKAVYSDNHEPAITKRLFQLAHQHQIPVFADLESLDDFDLEVLSYIDYLIAPWSIIYQLTQQPEEEFALQQCSKEYGIDYVIATKGIDGSIGFHRGEFHSAKSVESQSIDTTGAGDAYHAGFIAGRLAGHPWKKCMEIASHVAAIKCNCIGPRINTKLFKQIEKLF